MLSKQFNKLKNYFKKENIEDFTYTSPDELKIDEQEIVIPDVKFCEPEIEGRPNILIMDDFIGMVNVIQDELERVQCCDVHEHFNIITATGNYAAFSVEKYLKNPDKRIDAAILDITLGGVINSIEYDGIDTAIMIKEHNPDCVIRFITGHTLNKRNPAIFKFMQKFEHFFNASMDETKTITFNNKKILMYKHVIHKNGNRVESLGDLIQEYNDLNKDD